MLLLQVTSSNFFSTYGGGQVYVKNLVDELVRQGIETVIAMPESGEEIPEFYNGCQLVGFNSHASAAEIEALLARIKPSVVHLHGYKALFAKACYNLGIRCLVTAHHGGIVCPAGTLLNHNDRICSIPANPHACLPCVLRNTRGGTLAYPFLKFLPVKTRLWLGAFIGKFPFIYFLTPLLKAQLNIGLKANEWCDIYTYATVMIAPSHAIARSMERNDCPTGKIKVIPHGIPLSQNKPERFTAPQKDETIRFFYVGRICYVKGVHIMLRAFVQAGVGKNAELHIVGGAGNKAEERYMQRLQRKYKHLNNIVWHGKIFPHLVNEKIAQWDVMIHPTICLEVFGLNIAESLAMGKAVIATRCGGAEMQIVDGVNGWLVEANDVDEMAVAMKKVNNNNLFKLKINKVISIEDHVYKLKPIFQ